MIVLLALIICLSPTFATASNNSDVPQKSVFLTGDEFSEAVSKSRKRTSHSKAGITLDAIAFIAADDWSIWIDGKKWTPETIHKSIKVLNVTQTHATLSVKNKTVTLKPGDGFVIKNNFGTDGNQNDSSGKSIIDLAPDINAR